MATQYTDRLRLALPTQGELTGTWGDVVNVEVTELIEQAIAGFTVVNTWTTNTHVLTASNGTDDEARSMVLSLTDTGGALSAAGELICPTQSKVYIVDNTTGQDITIKTAAGAGVTIPTGLAGFVYCDGTKVVDAISYVPFDNSASGLTATNVKAAIDELDGRLDTAEADITVLDGRLDTAEADITALQSTTGSLGTAAFDDAQTSALDTTAGALMAVGAFGLGTASVSILDDLDNNQQPSGLYYSVTGTTANNTIDGSSFVGSVLIIARANGARVTQYAISEGTLKAYIRNYNSGRVGAEWEPWQEIWHTGNLVKTTSPTDTTAGSITKVGDFGVGSAIFLTSGDTATFAEGKYVVTSAVLNLPRAGVSFNIDVTATVGLPAKTFYANELNTNRFWIGWNANGGAITWQEIWHTGNLPNPASTTDLAAVAFTGSYTDLINTPVIRSSLLDSYLCRLFTPNKLVDRLNGALTWERNSTATYVDRYGVVQTALADEPREESEGWLIEGASTNLLTDSEDFSSWPQGGASVTTNAIAAPDGSLTADLIDDTDTINFQSKGQAVLNVAGDYTVSVFVKKGTSSVCSIASFATTDNDFQVAFIDLNDGTVIGTANGVVSVTVKECTDGWFRVILVCNASVSQTVDARIYPIQSNGAATTGNIYAWGAQIEALPFASSYIPTTTAPATRAADVVKAPVRDNFVSGNQGDWSFSTIFQPFGYRTQVLFGHDGVQNDTLSYSVVTGSGSNISVRDFDFSTSTVGNYIEFKSCNYAAVRDGANLTAYVDGVAGQTRQPTENNDFDLDGTVRIGAQEDGLNAYYGHMQDFRIYDFALNADEVTYLAGVK